MVGAAAAARSGPPRTSRPIDRKSPETDRKSPGLGRIWARGWRSCRRRGPRRRGPGGRRVPLARAAPPASPLDELLARHLKLGRGGPTAGGGEGDAKEDWRERYRRRRANPFASFAANDAKLAVDASQQTPGFAMLHSG